MISIFVVTNEDEAITGRHDDGAPEYPGNWAHKKQPQEQKRGTPLKNRMASESPRRKFFPNNDAIFLAITLRRAL
jgi:hypothetical protein